MCQMLYAYSCSALPEMVLVPFQLLANIAVAAVLLFDSTHCLKLLHVCVVVHQ